MDPERTVLVVPAPGVPALALSFLYLFFLELIKLLVEFLDSTLIAASKGLFWGGGKVGVLPP